MSMPQCNRTLHLVAASDRSVLLDYYNTVLWPLGEYMR